MSEWISVEERLPPNDICVLVAIFDYRPKVEMYFHGMGCRYNHMWTCHSDGKDLEGKGRKITHWYVLPDLPKVDK